MHRLFYGLALCLLTAPALAQTGGRHLVGLLMGGSCAECGAVGGAECHCAGRGDLAAKLHHAAQHSGSPTLSVAAYARAEYQLLGATAPGQPGRHSRSRSPCGTRPQFASDGFGRPPTIRRR